MKPDTVISEPVSRKRGRPQNQGPTINIYIKEFIDFVKEKHPNDTTKHLEDVYPEYGDNKRYTSEFIQFSSRRLKKFFGHKEVEKYKLEFIQFLHDIFGEKALEYVENKNIPLIKEAYPETSRYTDEYLEARNQSNENVKKFRENAKNKDIEMINKIKDKLALLITYVDDIIIFLNEKKICFSCYKIASSIDIFNCCLNVKKNYLSFALYSIFDFLGKYSVCNFCQQPHKGINSHLIKCSLNLSKTKSEESFSKVIPNDKKLNDLIEGLNKMKFKNVALIETFDFAEKIISQTIDDYKESTNLKNNEHFDNSVNIAGFGVKNSLEQEKTDDFINDLTNEWITSQETDLIPNDLLIIEKNSSEIYVPKTTSILDRVYSNEAFEMVMHDDESKPRNSNERNQLVSYKMSHQINLTDNNNMSYSDYHKESKSQISANEVFIRSIPILCSDNETNEFLIKQDSDEINLAMLSIPKDFKMSFNKNIAQFEDTEIDLNELMFFK